MRGTEHPCKLPGVVNFIIILAALEAEGIPVHDGYSPLDRNHELFPSETFAKDFYDAGARVPRLDPASNPVSQMAWEQSIWLPHQLFLGTDADLESVALAVAKVQKYAAEL